MLRLPHDRRASFLRTAPECVLEHIISVTWAADSHSNVIRYVIVVESRRGRGAVDRIKALKAMHASKYAARSDKT